MIFILIIICYNETSTNRVVPIRYPDLEFSTAIYDAH